MIKNIKFVIVILIFVILVLIAFFFFAKSRNVDPSQYHLVKKYRSIDPIPSDTFSLMTYNIGYLSGMANNQSKERIDSLFIKNLTNAYVFIEKYKPDIIGFQEIDFASSRSLGINQLDSIAINTSYKSGFQSINWDKKYIPFPYWPPQHHFGKIVSGQAILSNFEIAKIDVITLEKPLNSPYYYNALYIDRLIQIASVNINNQAVTLMNLHLEAFHEETRLRHAIVVKDIFEQYAKMGPVLLFGDFNSQPIVDSLNTSAIEIILQSEGIQSVVIDKDYSENPRTFFTYSSANPERMIDHIFYTEDDFEVIESKVLFDAEEISDHLPLYTKMVLSFDKNTDLSNK